MFEVKEMNIVAEEIEHCLFGKGKVISQEAEMLSIQFSEEYGLKQFIYPDAFEKYLRLCNPGIEMSVLEELSAKQMLIQDELLKRENEFKTCNPKKETVGQKKGGKTAKKK